MQTVDIIILGGAVQDVQCPPGVRVIIRDYDVDEADWENFDIRRDGDGAYQHMEFGNDGEKDGNSMHSRKAQLPIDRDAVDWGLLRSQKKRLVEIADALREGQRESLCSSDIQTLDGLIHLLDHIQDEASLSVSEKTIFGNLQGEKVADVRTSPAAEHEGAGQHATKPDTQSDTVPLEPS